MTPANRLNQMIDEQKISKREFAKRLEISENYVYTLPRIKEEVFEFHKQRGFATHP